MSNIQPTSLNSSNSDNPPVQRLEAILDSSDRDFLKLLNTLGSSTVTKPTATIPTQPAPQAAETHGLKLLSTPTESTEKAEAKDTAEAPQPTETELTKTKKVPVENEIDLLKADISLTDMITLQHVANAAIQAPQPIPLQTLFQQDASGIVRYNGTVISERLAELVKKAYQSGHPIRVEVDPNTSVVLRIKNGRVSAEFLTSDAAAAMHIKQHLDSLRNRIQTNNLPVDQLTHRHDDSRQNHQPNPQDDDIEE